jgi:hypothetical protein
MTNTSREATPSLQTLHTFHVQRDKSEPAYHVERPSRIEFGKKVLYRITRDEITISGILDTLTSTADVDARDEAGQSLLHIEGITVERRGLDTFNSNEVVARSLARVAEIGFAWAGMAALDFGGQRSQAGDQSRVSEYAESISA